jgi:hypothetical protein
MGYVFTKHARERAKLRKINQREITKTLKTPDIREQKNDGTIALYRKLNGLAIKIVIAESKKDKKIITVHKIDAKRLKNIKNIIIN